MGLYVLLHLNRVNIRQLTTECVGSFKARGTAVPYGPAEATQLASIGFAEAATLSFIASVKPNSNLNFFLI